MCQHLPSRQASCYHHTLSDELVADQVNDQVGLNDKNSVVSVVASGAQILSKIYKHYLYDCK